MIDINTLPIPSSYRWLAGKIVDNFAGGGGASTGIAQAIGKSPDIAVNHNVEALMMHEENHPETKHYNESVWDINIKKALNDEPVLAGWFSPDCTHFSVAKGGKPVKKVIRGLAWIVKKWVGQSDMAVVFMENVKEFTTWGPLIAKRCKLTKRVIKLVADPVKKDKKGDPVMNEVVSEPGEYVPYREQALVPDKKRAGKTFKQFVAQLREAGYNVEWQVKGLTASDFGEPTTRNRFFLIARKDGLPIVWPTPTHGSKKLVRANPGKLQPWATAGENLDWSIVCPSIFDRKKPLAEKTMARIFKGIQKFVIDAGDDAFLVKTNHGGEQFRGQSLDNPMATITSKHGTGLAAVSLSKFNQNSIGQSVDKPIDTVMAGATRFAMVEAQLKSATARNAFLPVQGGFITTIDHGGARSAPTSGLDEPISTMTLKARHIKVAALLKHYTGVVGQSLELPLPTITATDHNSVMDCTLEPMAASSLVKLKGTCKHGQSLDRPLDAIAAQGNHYAEIRSTLEPVVYHSSPLENGGNDGRDDGIQSFGESQGVRGEAGRNDLEIGRPHQQREGQAQGAEAYGQADEKRLPGSELLVSEQAVHGERSSSGVRGAGGAHPAGAGHQPRKGEQARQQPGVPGADDQGQQPSSCIQDGTQSTLRHANTGRNTQTSQSSADDGNDVPGDSSEHGHIPNLSFPSREAQVRAFLVTYYGTGQPIDCNEPLDTITSKARFGVVTIHGQDYQIVDIGMRMLEPHELYRCQGFPEGYKHQVVMGKKLAKHAQVRMVGNSVPPGLARVLVQANIPRWALEAA